MRHRINHSFPLNGKNASQFSDASLLPRHRWYYYKEGFSPNLVNSAFETYNLNENSKIFDPFNGSGTVTLSAAEKGIASTGIEVNPFTSFVAKTKTYNTKKKSLDILFEETYENIKKGSTNTFLEEYSTFTESNTKKKWLFNLDVLRSFNGGFDFLKSRDSKASEILKLVLIASVMEVCNARKDGKCLKYKPNWSDLDFSKKDLINSVIENFVRVEQDLIEVPIKKEPKILNGDSRNHISKIKEKFDLIITSPPYLNTFDYTDIYRPELFLGGFIKDAKELQKLRHETVRSHIQIKWKMPNVDNIQSMSLRDIYKRLNSKKDELMNKNIPLMILAYFEDMANIFKQLSYKIKKNGHMWIVVSNSAYANEEIPVDLILADLASKNGWKLSEIGVLRHINKRKTKHSPDIKQLRESVIILEKR